METKYIAALAAFLGGSLISLINALITAKQVKSEEQSFGNASIIRQVFSVVYFAGTFFVVKKLGIDHLMPMIGAAVGLTVPAILFTITIAKNMKGDD